MNWSRWWTFTGTSEAGGRARGPQNLRKCMNAILQFVLKHGYAVLFGALFAHQAGLPIPGPLFFARRRGTRGPGRFRSVRSLRQLLDTARHL